MINADPPKGHPPRYNNVLLIEDEEPFRRILARNLTARGVNVMESSSAAEALSMIEQHVPDLLLLDISLPDATGWDVLRALKRRRLNLPSIVFTAGKVPPDRLSEFQPVAYLPKPFPLESLLRLVVGKEDEDGG